MIVSYYFLCLFFPPQLGTKSRYGTPSLSLFSELVNREMMWTISEVVSEPNVNKRMRIVKQYIKVARQCRETQNFNSMFAIISGLGHGAVSRYVRAWRRKVEDVAALYERERHTLANGKSFVGAINF